MVDGDDIPDPTKLGQLFPQYFDPVLPIETAELDAVLSASR